MDNEEIRKLLQELKKNSDESTAVRSKVVKIHFDTPEEAERRRRMKRRAEEEEARKQQEEQARAEAEEEERRREAEKAAMEAVEEAKLEAKAGFASDLEQDLQSAMELPDEEEDGENADDLDLNWEYEEPRLSTDAPEEEEEDDGFTGGDEEEFREPEDPTMTEEDPIRSLFGSIAGGLASLADRFREKGEEEREADEDGDEPEGEVSEDAPKTEKPGIGRLSLRRKKAKPEGSRKTQGTGGPDLAKEAAAGAADAAAGDENASGESAADGHSGREKREADPEEEWKLRMEQPPRRSLRRRRIPDKPVIALEKPQPEEEMIPGEQEATPQSAGEALPRETVPGSDETGPFITLTNEEFPNREDTAEQEARQEEQQAEQEAQSAGAAGQEAGRPAAQEEDASNLKSIAVVDLDENTNSKGVEVIPLEAWVIMSKICVLVAFFLYQTPQFPFRDLSIFCMPSISYSQ